MALAVATRTSVDNDTSSFADVFNTHHRELLRLAWLLTGNEDLAEDVVADAFAKVYRPWKQGRVDNVGGYLRTAVVNRVNSGFRRLAVERREASKRASEPTQGSPEQDAADRDEVWQALRQLPIGQRTAIVLRYWDDLTEAQAAEVMGVSVGTVKSQTAKGLARIRHLLQKGGDA
ncbi:MAG: SigE family RNA polymerase sigma factor [Nitriliruptorales bacterium]|nr:SigE family RNA polymerase sigma factor [Nitriliruptorales bacterium]